MADSSAQDVLVTHAILVGLTPLIPIPFVDDVAQKAFSRSLTERLAARHERILSSEQIKTLIEQPSGNFFGGVAGKIALYPAKKLFRKVFYVLEWKRAVDLISATYYRGFLLDVALEENGIEQYGAAKVRAALERVLARTNTSPLHHAASGLVGGSKGAFRHVGQLLGRALPNDKNVSAQEVAGATAKVESQDKEFGGLVARLKGQISSLPTEHFQQIRAEFVAEMKNL
jgi:hypothetical protein